jgi:methylated-DNA-[protein]-cysteine S-methyltransferase
MRRFLRWYDVHGVVAYDGPCIAIFDTRIGRCGIAWGPYGIVGVQLPEAADRRRRRSISDAAKPLRAEYRIAIEGITALLRDSGGDLSDVSLDMNSIRPSTSASTPVRTIPRGETHTWRPRQQPAPGVVYALRDGNP